MNQYGAIAQQALEAVAADQLRGDRRPHGTYFTDLGEQAADEITRLWA